MPAGLFTIHTFGCQMNEHDSERLAGLLREAGYEPSPAPEESDLVVVNTCSVRAKSEEKLFSLLGRLAFRKKRRAFRLAVVGCTAQIHGERIMARVPEVDYVLGPESESRLPELLSRGIGKAVALEQSAAWRESEPRTVPRASPASAYVTIMEGCDNFCTYCIVPYARGREKYRPARLVRAEVESLVRDGYKEITLLGQNVNSYRDPEGGLPFSGLLCDVGSLAAGIWLRFLTSHPKNFGSDLIAALKTVPALCRQIHLPLQSGSSRVLKTMNRGYSRDDYLGLVSSLREAMPGLELSTDVIVGFPGETEEDFVATLDVLDRVRFANIFSFRFSPRPMTAAAGREDDVPLSVKKRRLIELQALQKGIQHERNRALVGTERTVLCTGVSKKGGPFFCGRDESHRVVNFSWNGAVSPLHRFLSVRISDCGPYSLRGEGLGFSPA
ncbi:MAG: tRNA (N6-isopentenyl adenosine(37)-C2)-methylthiotransferase MiaB [Candidatus Aminicenantes bacterium]|nr:tRNA (N6-isopentenyl adenosine(37)-C2)-methylthiotransferase MiaB [Candidatus Aminicenantes bacterium]